MEADVLSRMRIEAIRGVSALGPWSYSIWRPPQLGGLIDHLWAYTGPSTHRRKRIFPNGCAELILNFGDPYRLLEGNGIELCRSAWLGGLQAGPMVIEQPAFQHVVGVRLRPAGARAVVACPMHEVAELSVELADVVGPSANELAERCEAANSVPGRFRVVAEWIGRRFIQAHAIGQAVAWTMAQLDESGGVAPIAALRERTGMSKTRLVEAFRDQVGSRRSCTAASCASTRHSLFCSARRPRLTDVALDGQFYDQAHMNAEFRALGGLTPREFLAARHPVGDASTVSDGPPAAARAPEEG